MSVTEARRLAVRKHENQRDRDGSFHIAHVARVAERVPLTDGYQRVAWLHDVFEDSETGIDELRDRLPSCELEALLLLTRRADESYEAYSDRIAGAPGDAGCLARAVSASTARLKPCA